MNQAVQENLCKIPGQRTLFSGNCLRRTKVQDIHSTVHSWKNHFVGFKVNAAAHSIVNPEDDPIWTGLEPQRAVVDQTFEA